MRNLRIGAQVSRGNLGDQTMRKIWLSMLGAGALMLAAAAAVAQPAYPDDSYQPPTPLEQHDMHTGSATTNGSSSVAYDRYGAHADGFPKIRLADNGDVIEGRAWRHGRRHHHHHRMRDDGYGG
jgi:hypothetical protein